MAAKMSVLALILSFSQYLSSAKARFPFSTATAFWSQPFEDVKDEPALHSSTLHCPAMPLVLQYSVFTQQVMIAQ